MMEANTLLICDYYRTWHNIDDDQWVVMGVSSIVRPNATVKIRKPNGDIVEATIVNVDPDFELESNGDIYRYGYLMEREDEQGSDDLENAIIINVDLGET